MKKILILSAFAIITFSCADKKVKTSGVDGRKVFKQNCVVCHGLDGKLGLNGSKDLALSKMSLDERKAIIKNGKGNMVGLGTLLKPEQIEAVAEYTLKLK
ncbi:MAG: cytochrome c6 [Saprospiraceae bacterium]|jgi:cytochrome c6|tara:strand:- start:92 stop:391 length:300 start_codon:yes stop_codon:yes gene_type:complete